MTSKKTSIIAISCVNIYNINMDKSSSASITENGNIKLSKSKKISNDNTRLAQKVKRMR